ncbi:hypothetical protein P7K49_004448, partial [Saguinus oedipus]
ETLLLGVSVLQQVACPESCSLREDLEKGSATRHGTHVACGMAGFSRDEAGSKQ